MLQYLRLPTPKKFVGFFDLQHGVELILMSVLINKFSGIFGVLAIFSGAEISIIQHSMYFYSLTLFALLCVLIPQIRLRSPLASLSFAYLYLLDSVINIAYTLLFGFTWFMLLASPQPASTSSSVSPAGKVVDETTGFAASALNVSAIDSITGRDGGAVASSPDVVATGFGAGVLQPESATSILAIAIFWVIRLYFIIIVFAFARQVVRSSTTPTEEPFEGQNGGVGWQGRLGRALISVGKGYWQGDGWAPLGGNKFRRSSDPGDGRRFRRDRMSVEV